MMSTLLSGFGDLSGSGISGAVNGEFAARVRGRQIDAVMRFTPMAIAVNLFNAILVAYIVSDFANPFHLLLWGAGILGVCAVALGPWIRRLRAGPRQRASQKAVSRATIQASALGALWGTVPVLWFADAEPTAQLVVGTVTTGMICAGGFALATIKPAASAYVAIMTVGGLVGLSISSSPYTLVLSALLLVYSTVVMRSAWDTANLFARQVIDGITLRERGETIELLLAEFEEHGSDWLFELNGEGRIIKFSARLSEVSGIDSTDLAGMELAALLSAEGREQLAGILGKGQPFRNLTVQSSEMASYRWWSITAHPIADHTGLQRGWRGVGSDITKTKKAQDRVEVLANTDSLTGLWNRRRFLEIATDALAVNDVTAIGCLDLNSFKQINDRFGHAAGDHLLKLVADELLASSNESVQVCRIGGDEFGILFRSSFSIPSVMESAQSLADRISGTYHHHGSEFVTSASIGVAPADPGETDVYSLLRKADFALYRAKSSKKPSVSMYDPTMHREIEEAERLRADLACAIEKNELQLNYQPIVELAAGRVVAFEALLRWHHPKQGLVSPDTFIPIAERSGLIVPIGEWVLKKACSAAATWPESVSVSVNVSPLQMSRSDLAATVAKALDEAGLPPHRLELEVTETIFVENEEKTLGFLNEMRLLGVKIALDDFGTGYSSLGYLGRFPVDKLKIDQSFVRGEQLLSRRNAIVQATIGMARSLNLCTTAEGIEDEQTLAWLRLSGCILGQGYLFSKPVGEESVMSCIAEIDSCYHESGNSPLARANGLTNNR